MQKTYVHVHYFTTYNDVTIFFSFQSELAFRENPMIFKVSTGHTAKADRPTT